MNKHTYEQALSFVNTHQRTQTIREWNSISKDQRQATADYLLKETGWTIDEFFQAETQHHLARN